MSKQTEWNRCGKCGHWPVLLGYGLRIADASLYCSRCGYSLRLAEKPETDAG